MSFPGTERPVGELLFRSLKALHSRRPIREADIAAKGHNLRRIFFRDASLTLVSFTVTSQSSLIEGRGAEAHRVMRARAVPAGGFAACSRRLGHHVSRHYDRGGRCIPGLGQAKAGNARSDHVLRKPGLKLSLWDGIIPLGESRGGTPASVRAPLSARRVA